MMEHFSTNLVDASKAHLTFLTTLHALGVTVTPPVVESLRRYVDLWLPLVHAIQRKRPSSAPSEDEKDSGAPPVSENPGEEQGGGTRRLLQVPIARTATKLIPPPDVAWLWHCHRLAPSRYEAYVTRRFGCVLEASPTFAVQQPTGDARPSVLLVEDRRHEADADSATTRMEWDRLYPDQPFFLLDDGIRTSSSSRLLTSHDCRCALDGFDLLGSTQNQSTFLWQVSRPQFVQEDFLRQGVERYYKFLKLSVKGVVLVPTYQIDLVWHTHILSSIRLYNQDCMKICHHRFYHDDSLGDGDRTPGGDLDRAFEATDAIWRSEYMNEPYKVEGTLYRGEPPPSFFNYVTWVPVKALSGSNNGAASLPDRPAMAIKGATSTGRKEEEWKDVSSDDGISSTGEALFIPAVPAPYLRHSFHPYRNPPRPGYAFGRNPTHGWGYYSLETKEGWEVTYERLRVREAKAHTKLDSYYCRNCCCAVFGRLSPNQLAEQKLLQTKLADIRDQMDDVKRVIRGTGPPSPSYQSSSRGSPYDYPVDAILLTSACGGSLFVRHHKRRVATACGGGCGGVHHAGGGCGGGGCGGGGCGGAGCGGGGCGGGGCGGG